MRLRDNRRRRQSGLFLVDGWREAARAVAGGLRPRCVYFVQDEAAEKRPPEPANDADVETVMTAAEVIQPLSSAALHRISYGEKTRGVVAEFAEPTWNLEALSLSKNAFVLVLDSIEKPGNLGAVFRSADAAGVDAVVLTGRSIDPFNPNAIRSSLGTLFTVPAAVASREELESFLIENRFSAFAARPQSSSTLWQTPWDGNVAVVLGSEANGLGDAWQGTASLAVKGFRLPMLGKADSLNLSVTAAVVAFESTRRRDGRRCKD